MIELGSGLAIDTVTAEMVVVDRARLDEEFGTSLDPAIGPWSQWSPVSQRWPALCC